MAFWGVYLKPNEPYTLQYAADDAISKRLRITQATLGEATRNSPARSIVRCSVGDKPAIAICSLCVRELTCCQLELEFEESHDVVFSVMGPRGVYLAGYLINPAPTAHQYTIDHKGQEKAMHVLHEDDHGSNKTGPAKESYDAQNTDIEHFDKNIKGGKRLLKCFSDKNREGKIIIIRKMENDGNEDSSFGTHKEYINQQFCSSDEDQEKTIAFESHSVFGKHTEEKRDAIEKKKKRKRNRKQKLGTLEANDQWDERFGSDSRITEENGSYLDAHQVSHDKAKKRKKKNKKHSFDFHKYHITGHMNGDSCEFDSRRPTLGNVEDDSFGKTNSREQEKKVGKIVLTKMVKKVGKIVLTKNMVS